MTFKYRTRVGKGDKPPISKPGFATTPEQLFGYVNGIDAAEGEERFARAIDKIGTITGYEFRVNPANVPRGMPGWLELDYLVHTLHGFRAFEIDDMSFVHRGQQEASETALKDLRRKYGLAEKGIQVQEIEHIDNARLLTQEDADRTAQELFNV